jgi:hypothetical protein
MPNLASLAPCLTQCRAGKVDDMKPPQQLSREAIELQNVLLRRGYARVPLIPLVPAKLIIPTP